MYQSFTNTPMANLTYVSSIFWTTISLIFIQYFVNPTCIHSSTKFKIDSKTWDKTTLEMCPCL